METQTQSTELESVIAPTTGNELSPVDMVNEIVAETKAAGRPELLRQPDALKAAMAFAQGIDTMRTAAVRATTPEQWTIFAGRDTAPMLHLRKASASVIRNYFQIVTVPDGPPRQITDSKGHIGFEVTGKAASMLTGVAINHIRGKKFEHEDFGGRKQYKKSDGRKVGVDVGYEDIKDSARTQFDVKCIALLSGLTACPVAYLADIWKLTPEQVEARAHRGAGYGKSTERKPAPAQKAPPPKTDTGMSAELKKSLVAIAKKRIGEGELSMEYEPLGIVGACAGKLNPPKFMQDLTNDDYDAMCNLIASFEKPAREREVTNATGQQPTEQQQLV